MRRLPRSAGYPTTATAAGAPAQVLVRLTPEEVEDAQRLAASSGMSVPALLRAGLTLLTATEASR
jgi:hypothetical protein